MAQHAVPARQGFRARTGIRQVPGDALFPPEAPHGRAGFALLDIREEKKVPTEATESHLCTPEIRGSVDRTGQTRLGVIAVDQTVQYACGGVSLNDLPVFLGACFPDFVRFAQDV